MYRYCTIYVYKFGSIPTSNLISSYDIGHKKLVITVTFKYFLESLIQLTKIPDVLKSIINIKL